MNLKDTKIKAVKYFYKHKKIDTIELIKNKYYVTALLFFHMTHIKRK